MSRRIQYYHVFSRQEYKEQHSPYKKGEVSEKKLPDMASKFDIFQSKQTISDPSNNIEYGTEYYRGSLTCPEEFDIISHLADRLKVTVTDTRLRERSIVNLRYDLTEDPSTCGLVVR
ncbi:hypothetical protein AVEN_126904-1 [Araneus ventricosus]|uniref:Uncharacterized protein n=1 Tax=Araneus ventricosus TaxID=182803 RepID=A0A4Y2C2N4_ARAVE|nr:hypothetical protein AVEN_126904-1 [Araneus ventricosus]